jgi:predicted phosphodiesterase
MGRTAAAASPSVSPAERPVVRLQLSVLDGGLFPGQAYPLVPGQVLGLTRDPAPPISRIHCRILCVEDGLRLLDRALTGRTWVNGTRLAAGEARFLRPGDVLRVALFEARLEPAPEPDWLHWNDGTVLRIAERIAAEQDHASLPILADALEEAGCTNPDLLTHCRNPRSTFRLACLTDFLQGKSASSPWRPAVQAILSDIHANLEALEAVLEDIAGQQVDEIFCLGDVFGYGPNPIECLDLVWASCRTPLLGNHDQALMFDPDGFGQVAERAIFWQRAQLEAPHDSPENRERRWAYLADWPRLHREEGTLFVHGSPSNPLTEYVFPEDIYNPRKMERIFGLIERCCFAGHTHLPGVFTRESEGTYSFFAPEELDYAHRLDHRKTLVNVGSVGQPRDNDGRACYILFDGESIRFRRIDYDIDTTIRKIYDIPDLENFLGDRLREGH